VNKIFICYDARARSGNTFDADVLRVADNITDVRIDNINLIDGVWFEYDADVDGDLHNERMRLDLASRGDV
jgi:hypothetical protein